MSSASHFSVHLARFQSLRTAETIAADKGNGVLFCGVAADTRAAATEPASQQAFKFLVLGIHETAESANWFVDNRSTIAPWLNDAVESWAGVLQPFRHLGEANFVNKVEPGPFFGSMGPAPAPDAPIVIVTSSGWVTGDQLDMNRVREFSNGVMSIRASMTGVDGLHSQQSFFFKGVLEYDPVTVTMWRDAASARAFAYGPGVHRNQIARQQSLEKLSDRTSFTRCSIVRSEGTWHSVSV